MPVSANLLPGGATFRQVGGRRQRFSKTVAGLPCRAAVVTYRLEVPNILIGTRMGDCRDAAGSQNRR